MRAVVVVVDVPHGDRGIAGILAIELASVEQLFAQVSLVALNLAVVTLGVQLGLLIARWRESRRSPSRLGGLRFAALSGDCGRSGDHSEERY